MVTAAKAAPSHRRMLMRHRRPPGWTGSGPFREYPLRLKLSDPQGVASACSASSSETFTRRRRRVSRTHSRAARARAGSSPSASSAS